MVKQKQRALDSEVAEWLEWNAAVNQDKTW